MYIRKPIIYFFVLLTAHFSLANILERNNIKAIIFDMGGVLVPLDWNMWRNNLEEIGLSFSDNFQDEEIKQLTTAYGSGKVSTQEFQSLMLKKTHVSLERFKSIWNSVIISISNDAIEYIKNLRNNGYKIYLLSDTNEIHMKFIEELYQTMYSNGPFYTLFDKCYLSFLTTNSKSDEDDKAWLQIIREQGFKPEECLFIDDLLKNVERAKALGFNIFHYKTGSKMSDVFPGILK